MRIDPDLREQAVEWAVRTRDPKFADWDGFITWLDSDREHAMAYDEVVSAIDVAANALRAAAPNHPLLANDNDQHRQWHYRVARRRWLGGAVAASLALLAGVWVLRPGSGTAYSTEPGEISVVALGDGSTVTLAGNTRMVLVGRDRRIARLEQGQALFDLKFKGGSPFEVQAGDDTMRDIGTVFEVRRLNAATTVSVAEGAVLFNPDRQRITMRRGQGLTSNDETKRIVRQVFPVGTVGEWREGRQSFRDTPLQDVAEMLSAATGRRFVVAPGAQSKAISGSVLLDPIRADPGSIGPLLGVTARREGDAWLLEP